MANGQPDPFTFFSGSECGRGALVFHGGQGMFKTDVQNYGKKLKNLFGLI